MIIITKKIQDSILSLDEKFKIELKNREVKSKSCSGYMWKGFFLAAILTNVCFLRHHAENHFDDEIDNNFIILANDILFFSHLGSLAFSADYYRSENYLIEKYPELTEENYISFAKIANCMNGQDVGISKKDLTNFDSLYPLFARVSVNNPELWSAFKIFYNVVLDQNIPETPGYMTLPRITLFGRYKPSYAVASPAAFNIDVTKISIP